MEKPDLTRHVYTSTKTIKTMDLMTAGGYIIHMGEHGMSKQDFPTIIEPEHIRCLAQAVLFSRMVHISILPESLPAFVDTFQDDVDKFQSMALPWDEKVWAYAESEDAFHILPVESVRESYDELLSNLQLMKELLSRATPIRKD